MRVQYKFEMGGSQGANFSAKDQSGESSGFLWQSVSAKEKAQKLDRSAPIKYHE